MENADDLILYFPIAISGRDLMREKEVGVIVNWGGKKEEEDGRGRREKDSGNNK